MDIKSLTSAINCGYAVKIVAENEWEIALNLTLANGFKPKVYIKKMADKWFLSDKKSTLRFMNTMYELGATDVKNCIAGVLKIYGFTITAGEIFVHLTSDAEISAKLTQLVCCMTQLAFMYVFFDKP